MGNSSLDVEIALEQDEKKASPSALDGRRMVTAALLVAMMVTAMEQLVVSPAMPTIIAQLRGFEIYPWVISAYLLAATVSTPIYGKLADLFGRKRILLFGLVLFSLGSILSGTSMTMGQLIAMRTLQGLGAGAVGPIVPVSFPAGTGTNLDSYVFDIGAADSDSALHQVRMDTRGTRWIMQGNRYLVGSILCQQDAG